MKREGEGGGGGGGEGGEGRETGVSNRAVLVGWMCFIYITSVIIHPHDIHAHTCTHTHTNKHTPSLLPQQDQSS